MSNARLTPLRRGGVKSIAQLKAIFKAKSSALCVVLPRLCNDLSFANINFNKKKHVFGKQFAVRRRAAGQGELVKPSQQHRGLSEKQPKAAVNSQVSR